jgi:hypothetical protein
VKVGPFDYEGVAAFGVLLAVLIAVVVWVWEGD